MRLSPLAGVGIVVLVLATAGCQAIADLLPTLPTKANPSPSPSPKPGSSPSPSPKPSPTAALPAISIPVVLPTPLPTPTPAPTPAPTTPPPEPPPSSSSCALPPSNPSNPSCAFNPPQLEADVEWAMTRTTEAHPEYFNQRDTRCPNCYLVLNVDGYVREVQRQLASRGVCSFYDGEELAVKSVNAFSEQYDILLASGHMRRAPSAYRGDCHPSWF